MRCGGGYWWIYMVRIKSSKFGPFANMAKTSTVWRQIDKLVNKEGIDNLIGVVDW